MKKIIFTFITILVTLSISAQTDVYPPTLIKPLDADTNQMPDVILDWSAVAGVGQVSYELQLDFDSLFSNPAIEITYLSSFETSNLFFEQEYFWKVRAIDDLGTSDWSDVFNFITFIHVKLHNPDSGAVGQMPDVLLEWEKFVGPNSDKVDISGITYFDYEISLDTNFTNPIYGSVNINIFSNNNTFYVNASELFFGTEYFWRIRARHEGDTCNWCEYRAFTTTDNVELEEPVNGATNQMLDVTLKWEEITGISGYMYEICTDPNFILPFMSVTDTNAIIASMVDFGEIYY
ncbi:MAG: hypothetical protein K8R58_00820, partial [Bacteroidales bacterium]|nr:hypothetical protein [Bacteroidales bacterium]